jgi:hypothetical protein
MNPAVCPWKIADPSQRITPSFGRQISERWSRCSMISPNVETRPNVVEVALVPTYRRIALMRGWPNPFSRAFSI